MEIDHDHFRVAVFGSARIKEGDECYQMVEHLGELIGEEGYDIVTGGGPGVMDAASAGHEKGSKEELHNIGLLIKLPHEQVTSKHLNIKEEFDNFPERLAEFAKISDAIVVAPGGLGTMLEMCFVWQLLQVKMISHVPIILMSPMWSSLEDWIRDNLVKNKYMKEEDLNFVYSADTPEEVMGILKATYKDFEKN